MNTRMLTNIGFLAATLLFGAFSAPSHTQPPLGAKLQATDLRGHWQGFFEPLGADAGIIGPEYRPADLFIRSQLLGAFGGSFSLSRLSPEPHPVPVNGTLLGNQVNFLGLSRDGGVRGGVTLHDFGNGAAILDGELNFQPAPLLPPNPILPPNQIQQGSLLQLRRFLGGPDTAPPNLTGTFVGFAVSDVTGDRLPVSSRLVAERIPGGALSTGFSLNDVSIQPCVFPVGLGTINPRGRTIVHDGVPTTAFDVVIIGQGEGENLRLVGEYHIHAGAALTPCVRGEYFMQHSDGPDDFGTFEMDLQLP